jgi:hypothetical protein
VLCGGVSRLQSPDVITAFGQICMTGFLYEDIVLFSLMLLVVSWIISGLLGWIFMVWLFIPVSVLRWVLTVIRRRRS